ncbi:hypothetical protein [Ensifer sp. Root142]|uniref:hypothetical protein n=1 Tax=Ensifer sp. Root142 TaxID=1736461 RepID=UPI0012E8DB8D|nr:hypothetical protein [Ensifer sp. Root142]
MIDPAVSNQAIAIPIKLKQTRRLSTAGRAKPIWSAANLAVLSPACRVGRTQHHSSKLRLRLPPKSSRQTINFAGTNNAIFDCRGPQNETDFAEKRVKGNTLPQALFHSRYGNFSALIQSRRKLCYRFYGYWVFLAYLMPVAFA